MIKHGKKNNVPSGLSLTLLTLYDHLSRAPEWKDFQLLPGLIENKTKQNKFR